MKFSEMRYERVDIEKLGGELTALTEAFKRAGSFEEAERLFLEQEKLSSRAETMWSLCYVRHTIDTEDKFYDAENDEADRSMPLLREYAQLWAVTFLLSPFRPQFEEKYGALMFRNIEMELRTFSPEIIPDLQEENRLTSEYAKLIASAQIEFKGEKRTLSQMLPFKQSRDDGERLAAWRAEGEFYAENGERLDELYDSLVAVRTAMAKKLGFESFTGLAYCRMNRNSYDAGDVEKFRAAVIKYLVPVAAETYELQAARIGKSYPLSFADAALSFRSGNAKPSGTPEQILAHGRKLYHELSPETAEFIDYMYENGLLDVLSRKGKAQGGYCTSFPDYKAQFIFANFNGTAGDVEVITHEAGHAFAGHTCRDIVPSANRQPTMESCEIHSMTMEFFAWPWAEGFFGQDTKKFRYGHLAAALQFIPYGAMVDHFQHLMYDRPGLTPAERHKVWRELMGSYMPWIKPDGIPFYDEGRGWQRQMHIYETPFYYIDYCLAQTVALRFWAIMQRDPGDAWERYMRLVRPGGRKTFTELVEAAGLESPFGGETLRAVSAAARDWLEHAAGEIEDK